MPSGCRLHGIWFWADSREFSFNSVWFSPLRAENVTLTLGSLVSAGLASEMALAPGWPAQLLAKSGVGDWEDIQVGRWAESLATDSHPHPLSSPCSGCWPPPAWQRWGLDLEPAMGAQWPHQRGGWERQIA